MFIEDTKKLWGFHPTQEAFFNSLKEKNKRLVPARVVFASHDHFKTRTIGSDFEKIAKVRGQFYHQEVNEDEQLPVVGDWVAIEELPGDHQFLRVEALLPRLFTLRRKDPQRGYQCLIANVDSVAVVTSFNDDLNERRLERAIAMITEGGATPLLLVNKSDLVDQTVMESRIRELSERLGGVTLVACSAQTGEGMDQITTMFELGQSVAFIGMSGVGKSTLINAILEGNHQLTQEIRATDGRGRHTTTHRQMFLTQKGFWIIDNPGVKEFSFSGDEVSLENAFDDIAKKIHLCRFKNCSHRVEPGCKIIAALDSGELARHRWENYLKIKREIELQDSKNSKLFPSQKRKDNLKRSKTLRQKIKSKDWNS